MDYGQARDRWVRPCPQLPGCWPRLRLGWGVSVVALFRFQRGCALFALFSKQAVLEVFYLRILENILLLKPPLVRDFTLGHVVLPNSLPDS